MSHRGNLVLVDENGYIVRRCHCALAILQLMFWGSEFSIQYILNQSETEGWYDLVWDEGSILIDRDKKIVILYGGEYLVNPIPRRHLFLELMRQVWDGWDIRWGYKGLIDIVSYVNFPILDISRDGYTGLTGNYLGVLDNDGLIDEWPDAVISIKFADTDIRVQYAIDTYELLQFGKKLIEKMWDVTTMTELVWEHDEPEFPIEGVHIDVPAKTIYFWSLRCIPQPLEWQNKWNNWKLIWLKDDYQTHIELTENRLKLDISSDETTLNHLRAYLLVDISYKEHKAKFGVFSGASVVSHNIEIPEYVTFYVDRLPPIAERTRIFNQAVEAWQQSRAK